MPVQRVLASRLHLPLVLSTNPSDPVAVRLERLPRGHAPAPATNRRRGGVFAFRRVVFLPPPPPPPDETTDNRGYPGTSTHPYATTTGEASVLNVLSRPFYIRAESRHPRTRAPSSPSLSPVVVSRWTLLVPAAGAAGAIEVNTQGPSPLPSALHRDRDRHCERSGAAATPGQSSTSSSRGCGSSRC